jgi:hypothetical protein
MSDEKPFEYYVEFSIRIKERGVNSSSYGQEVFNQKISWDYVQANPLLIPKVIAVINKLEVPHE